MIGKDWQTRKLKDVLILNGQPRETQRLYLRREDGQFDTQPPCPGLDG